MCLSIPRPRTSSQTHKNVCKAKRHLTPLCHQTASNIHDLTYYRFIAGQEVNYLHGKCTVKHVSTDNLLPHSYEGFLFRKAKGSSRTVTMGTWLFILIELIYLVTLVFLVAFHLRSWPACRSESILVQHKMHNCCNQVICTILFTKYHPASIRCLLFSFHKLIKRGVCVVRRANKDLGIRELLG